MTDNHKKPSLIPFYILCCALLGSLLAVSVYAIMMGTKEKGKVIAHADSVKSITRTMLVDTEILQVDSLHSEIPDSLGK